MSFGVINIVVYVWMFATAGVGFRLAWRVGRDLAHPRPDRASIAKQIAMILCVPVFLWTSLLYRAPEGETFSLSGFVGAAQSPILIAMIFAAMGAIYGWAVNYDNSSDARAARYEARHGAGRDG